LLHQGTRLIPVDFIGFFRPINPVGNHHEKLIANMFAQAEALAFGKEEKELPYKRFDGNRPSNIIMAGRLTPSSLEKLIALYEHKVFTQAVIWHINPFDQWGVELGKRLAKQIMEEFLSESKALHDPSTSRLIKHFKQLAR